MASKRGGELPNEGLLDLLEVLIQSRRTGRCNNQARRKVFDQGRQCQPHKSSDIRRCSPAFDPAVARVNAQDAGETTILSIVLTTLNQAHCQRALRISLIAEHS